MARERSGDGLAGQLGMLFSLGTVGEWSDGQLLGRFLDRQNPVESEAAFAVIVARHGAKVLRVCQRILGDSHDAHDAFQATFLLLVRKANTIRSRESIGDWLCRIARRIAVRASVNAARRRRRLEALILERRRLLGAEAAIPRDDRPDHGSLIAEVDRLPERFRAPVMLHYFEGLSTEATARRLGCARGTVLSRLSRARGRLRSRLERRGVSFDAVWPIGGVANRLAWTETVPPLLVQNTIRAGVSLGLASASIESVVPATVAALVRGVTRTLAISRIRTAACLLILAVAGVSLGIAASLDPADEPTRGATATGQASPAGGTSATRRAALPQVPARADSLVFRGEVIDPDGKPVAGAPVFLSYSDGLRPPKRLATSGSDGRFEAGIPLASLEGPGDGGDAVTYLAALTSGFGPGWVKIDRKAAEKPVVIRLCRDEVAIEGRILDLQGHAVPGARVSVFAIADLPNGFVTTLRSDAGQADPNALWMDVMERRLVLTKEGPLAAARTGADGRFRLNGLGRDRIVTLIVLGESIEETFATVLTTSDPGYKPLALALDDSAEFTLHGPQFELTVGPGRTIEGTVRDRDTGKPIAGAKVGSSWATGETTCDGQGRFRLTGMPTGPDNFLTAVAVNQSYVRVTKPVGDPKRLGPFSADVELKRGVWVTGRVINRSTGRPAKAIVHYLAFRDNPHLKDYPGAVIFKGITGSREIEYRTDADGRFRAVALPGGGILAVRSLEPGYLTAEPLTAKAAGNVLDQSGFEFQQGGFQALVPINPGDLKNRIPKDDSDPFETMFTRILEGGRRRLADEMVNTDLDIIKIESELSVCRAEMEAAARGGAHLSKRQEEQVRDDFRKDPEVIALSEKIAQAAEERDHARGLPRQLDDPVGGEAEKNYRKLMGEYAGLWRAKYEELSARLKAAAVGGRLQETIKDLEAKLKALKRLKKKQADDFQEMKSEEKNKILVVPDIALTPGRPQHVRPVGPDGRTVERTRNFGEHNSSSLGDLVSGAEFTFIHTRPGKPETVAIVSENREMAAFVNIKGGEPDPIRVVLRPAGVVSGRLVDGDGRPRPNVRLEVSYSLDGSRVGEQGFSPPLMTGADGRFKIRGLVPGLPYTVSVIRRGAKDEEQRYEGFLHTNTWTVQSGEVRDWGDVRATEG